MILNTGGRTDIVQYYSPWLLKRFKEGFVYSRNPLYPNKVMKYELTPNKIDCVIFCSKNYKPILKRLSEITDKFNTYFFYTITAYKQNIEPRVPSIDESIKTLIELEKIVSFKRIAWRYDPVFLNKQYTINYHAETFEYIAKQLKGHINCCIFSFVDMYQKLKNNKQGIRELTTKEKEQIAKILRRIAKKYNIPIQTCAEKENFENFGIIKKGCINLDTLAKANNIEFRKLKHKGMRQNCICIESRDIGMYDSCPNGCAYCYANSDFKKSIENYKLHNENSQILLGTITPQDIIQQANQKSFLTPMADKPLLKLFQ